MRQKITCLNRVNRPAAAGISYTLSSFLERGAAIIFTPIYTRLLTPEEYGIYSLYVSFMGIVTVTATLEIQGNALYLGLKEFSDEKSFVSSAAGLISLSSLFTLAAYILFHKRLNEITGLGSFLSFSLILQVFLNGIRALKISETKYHYGHRLPLFEGLFFAVFVPVLSVLFILFLPRPEYARIIALLLASLIFTLPIFFSVLKKGNFKLFSKDAWRFLARYTLPSIPHYISLAFIWQIGKIVVGRAFSPAEAGMLSLAISIGLLPNLLTSGMQSALLPWINRKLSEGEVGKEKIYSLIYSVFFPLCLTVCLFLLVCPELFSLMAAREYLPALFAVYPIAASLPIWFLINLFSPIIAYSKKTFFISLGTVLGAFFNLIFNLLFTFKLGFYFSAFLILPTSLIIFTVYSVVLKRKLSHASLPLRRLFYILLFFFVLVGATLLLKISFLARVFFGVAILMIFYPRAKELKALVLG